MTSRRERAPGALLQMPGTRGQTRGAPPALSALPGRLGDSPGTFGPDSSGAGVLLTSLPPPLGSRCPVVSLCPRSRRCPRPPPPYPLCQKCHSFSASGSFAKSLCGHPELGGNARRAHPAKALSRPPAAPCAGPSRGEELPRRGHRPLSAARGPLSVPRAFPSPSGCSLPVPRVLIPLLMNILTEANVGEVN